MKKTMEPIDLLLFSNAFRSKLVVMDAISILESRSAFINWEYQMAKLDGFLTDKADLVIIDKMLLSVFVNMSNEQQLVYDKADYLIAGSDAREWQDAFACIENLFTDLYHPSPVGKRS